jgi:3-dehydroquinate synthase
MTLKVTARQREYPIHFSPGAIDNSGLWSTWVEGRRVFIVTNNTVAPLYAQRLTQGLASAISVEQIVLPDGEEHKHQATLGLIYDHLLAAKADRRSILLALGGGVIGDMTGYAAATYQRGIDFIQVPTTLLAMVDSSVGGKTGINHPRGKNMIGAFHAPISVVADPAVLATLPPREYAAGVAEAIKHGLIADPSYFTWIADHRQGILAREPALVAELVERSCIIKAGIVASDEFELTGQRAVLNLGHTFGHAFETELGYGAWLHGEAVAAGLVMAARWSQQEGHLTSSDTDTLINLLQAFSLPTECPAVPVDKLLSHMARDKKNVAGRIHLILLRRFGEAYTERNVPQAQLEQFLVRQGALT